MKGKYAARAALRREDESVQSEIETYQRNVKRLTAENKELTDALAAERAGRKQDIRRLKAQLDEGLSPELLALRGELERQRERANTAQNEERRTRRIWDACFRGLRLLLMDGLGLTGIEATEVILFLNPENNRSDGDPVVITGQRAGITRSSRLEREQILEFQAASGIRHRIDIVKLLKDKLDALSAASS